jgi:hypothetical protein
MKRSCLVPGWKDGAKGIDAPQLGDQSLFPGRPIPVPGWKTILSGLFSVIYSHPQELVKESSIVLGWKCLN